MRDVTIADLLRKPIRRIISTILIFVCIPSLFFNRGNGRNVLIHHHAGHSLHAHVVALADEGNHVHWHADHHGHEHDGVAARPHDEPDVPADGHSDTVIRGTEVATTKKHHTAAEPVYAYRMPAIFSAAAVSQGTAPAHGSFDHDVGVHESELACLRVVVLLI